MLGIILGCSFLMNIFFGIISFSSIIYGCINYLKNGIIPSTCATMHYFGWNSAALYSSKYVGYNEIINGFLKTNCIYGSFELLCISLIFTWMISSAVDVLDW
jgi:hypothetical protein